MQPGGTSCRVSSRQGTAFVSLFLKGCCCALTQQVMHNAFAHHLLTSAHPVPVLAVLDYLETSKSFSVHRL